MRCELSKQTSMLVLRSREDLVPKEHPIRQVKAMADAVLREMTGRFGEMYAGGGRESVPPEALLKGSLLIAIYSVRSERMFCEQLAYNMLFRWFLDMDMAEEPFNHSTFSKNRERLMGHDVAREFFQRVVGQARQAKLMRSEHFTVDGTLIESWASLKSLQPKDERRRERNRRKAKRRSERDGKGGGTLGSSNPTVDFRGQKRSNETHESKSDPEAKLARRGHAQPSKLYFGTHALMGNRNGLLVDLRTEEAHGTAERDTALLMLAEDSRIPAHHGRR